MDREGPGHLHMQMLDVIMMFLHLALELTYPYAIGPRFKEWQDCGTCCALLWCKPSCWLLLYQSVMSMIIWSGNFERYPSHFPFACPCSLPQMLRSTAS